MCQQSFHSNALFCHLGQSPASYFLWIIASNISSILTKPWWEASLKFSHSMTDVTECLHSSNTLDTKLCDYFPVFCKTVTTIINKQDKLGLSCAKLSSSWLQAYFASNQKISFKSGSRKFQECFKEVWGKFQGCLINVSRVFQVRGKCLLSTF